MSNILIIKHGSLGDIAQASGAIQDISDNHPNDDLYILSTKPYYDLLKKNPNKMIIFVLSNITENKLIIKFQNYKKIYFLSDKSYSVHNALKSDMVLFSKKSTIYNLYIGNK